MAKKLRMFVPLSYTKVEKVNGWNGYVVNEGNKSEEDKERKVLQLFAGSTSFITKDDDADKTFDKVASGAYDISQVEVFVQE